MPIEYNDFVKINYDAKLKDTGEIFDTTRENIAKENNVILNRVDYHPTILLIGSEDILSYLEKRLIGLNVGDKISFEIPCEEAFGHRDPGLLQTMSSDVFLMQGIEPIIGTEVEFDDFPATIIDVQNDNVTVDFNHVLAGEDLVYDVEILDIVDDDEEKIMGIIDNLYSGFDFDLSKTRVSIENDTAKIVLGESVPFEDRTVEEVTHEKFKIIQRICGNIEGIEKIQFIDEFELPTAEDLARVSDKSIETIHGNVGRIISPNSSLDEEYFKILHDKAVNGAINGLIQNNPDMDIEKLLEDAPKERIDEALTVAMDEATDKILLLNLELDNGRSFDVDTGEDMIVDIIKTSVQKYLKKFILNEYF